MCGKLTSFLTCLQRGHYFRDEKLVVWAQTALYYRANTLYQGQVGPKRVGFGPLVVILCRFSLTHDRFLPIIDATDRLLAQRPDGQWQRFLICLLQQQSTSLKMKATAVELVRQLPFIGRQRGGQDGTSPCGRYSWCGKLKIDLFICFSNFNYLCHSL